MANEIREPKQGGLLSAFPSASGTAGGERETLLEAVARATSRLEQRAQSLRMRVGQGRRVGTQVEGDGNVALGYLEALEAHVADATREIAARMRRISALVAEHDAYDAELREALGADSAQAIAAAPTEPSAPTATRLRKATARPPEVELNARSVASGSATGRPLRLTTPPGNARSRESYRVRGA